jgi:hypothetical protein
MPAVCSVYLLHGASTEGGPIEPQFPSTSGTLEYSYCLAFPNLFAKFGLGIFSNKLVIGPLTNDVFTIANENIARAYVVNGTYGSGYVDLYYF